MPIEIDRPKVDEVEAALGGALFERFQLFGWNLG